MEEIEQFRERGSHAPRLKYKDDTNDCEYNLATFTRKFFGKNNHNIWLKETKQRGGGESNFSDMSFDELFDLHSQILKAMSLKPRTKKSNDTTIEKLPIVDESIELAEFSRQSDSDEITEYSDSSDDEEYSTGSDSEIIAEYMALCKKFSGGSLTLVPLPM